MRIIGIDPGVAITGYAVVEESGDKYICLSSGCIETASEKPTSLRLQEIHNRILELVDRYNPRALAIEKIFFSKNVRTAFQVGEARGVVILVAAMRSLELFEYTPLQVKQAVAGYGNAEKSQVQKMVKLLLGLDEQPAFDDEADAIAVALCHLHGRRYREALKGGRP